MHISVNWKENCQRCDLQYNLTTWDGCQLEFNFKAGEIEH